ncbi:MAG TPA: RDD family protein [Aliidongia sp.]|nr:RDD family protein [Aliidongia sp.]
MAKYRDASEFLEGKRSGLRQITSPEGVVLPVELASYGERAAAYLIDMAIWLGITLLTGLIAALILRGPALIYVLLIMVFTAVLIRNLYFIGFELAWQGATPGKRVLGLRVVDRRGGPLQPGAVVARNLTREIEIYMPLGLMLTPFSGPGVWGRLAILAWLAIFLLLPLFTHYRLRGGDLIAGTMVIALPKRVLLGDLVEAKLRYRFSEPQLAAYGAFELQVLEELLRARDTADSRRLRREVCEKICRKIGWTTPVPDGETMLFLRDFYTAERAYLEREQLFGKPRADKHHAEAG